MEKSAVFREKSTNWYALSTIFARNGNFEKKSKSFFYKKRIHVFEITQSHSFWEISLVLPKFTAMVLQCGENPSRSGTWFNLVEKYGKHRVKKRSFSEEVSPSKFSLKIEENKDNWGTHWHIFWRTSYGDVTKICRIASRKLFRTRNESIAFFFLFSKNDPVHAEGHKEH